MVMTDADLDYKEAWIKAQNRIEKLEAAFAQSDAEPGMSAREEYEASCGLGFKTQSDTEPPRPDASAGLIEAAEWHEQRAEEFRIEAEQAGEPSPTPQVVTHLASAYEFRRRVARAVNRSTK